MTRIGGYEWDISLALSLFDYIYSTLTYHLY